MTKTDNKTDSKTDNKTVYHAGLFRRFASLVYDSLIITSILFLATTIAILLVSLVLGTNAITENSILVGNPIFFFWLVFTWFSYYAWCWRKSGQTLGMKAWRLKLITLDSSVISYKNALLRFFSAFLGLANLWALLPAKRGWHDILSSSNIIVTAKDQ